MYIYAAGGNAAKPLITKKKKHFNVTLNGFKLDIVRKQNLLGVKIDNGLSFNMQIEDLTTLIQPPT